MSKSRCQTLLMIYVGEEYNSTILLLIVVTRYVNIISVPREPKQIKVKHKTQQTNYLILKTYFCKNAIVF